MNKGQSPSQSGIMHKSFYNSDHKKVTGKVKANSKWIFTEVKSVSETPVCQNVFAEVISL